MRKYRVAVVQPHTGTNLEENLQKLDKLITEAAEGGAKLVALPEMSNVIGNTEINQASSSEETFQFFADLAKKHKIYIHGGSWKEPQNNSEKNYNTSFFFNDQGELLAKYRKIHTFDIVDPSGKVYRESDAIEAGDEIVTVKTELGVFGFAICYDLRFPEMYRLMAMKGAEIIFNPANFTLLTGLAHWEPLLQARAIENSCYLIAPNQYGQNERILAYGNSLIVDPWGKIISKAVDQVGITFGEIDLDYLAEVRGKMQTLENRRPQVYTLEEK